MQDFATKVLWAYIILLILGGLIGFLKAKSRVSLIASTVCGVILIIAAIPGLLNRTLAWNISNIIMALLLIVFAIRLAKTKKFMPNGLMLIITIAALALRNIYK